MAIYGSQFLENTVSTSISLDVNDLFIYDTRKDSDGGAWRLKTSHTSWYNEGLNTNIRGARKEFPVVALIACTNDHTYIYDADDPSFPLWMIIPSYRLTGSSSSTTPYALVLSTGNNLTSVAAANGKVYTGSGGNGAFYQDFVEDVCTRLHPSGFVKGGNIQSRNGALNFSLSASVILNSGYELKSTNANTAGAARVKDISVCIPPESPINPHTGLTRPRVAFVTEGEGVTIVREDVDETGVTIQYNPETAYDSSNSDSREFVSSSFDRSGNLAFITQQTQSGYNNLVFYENSVQPKYDVDAVYTRLDRNIGFTWQGNIEVSSRTATNLGTIGRWAYQNTNRILNDVVLSKDNLYIATSSSGSTSGNVPTLTVVDKQSLIEKQTSMHCTISNIFNTGWLPGVDKASLTYNTSATLTNTTIADRSSAARDFTITGSITTSSVYPNADVRSFSGFSNNTNMISRSHNADDLVGANDFTVACWFKTSSSASPQTFIAKGGAGTVPQWSLGLITQGSKLALIMGLEDNSGNAVDVTDSASGDLDDGLWHLAVGVAHFGALGKIYVDGVLVHTEDISAVGTVDNSAYNLTIGSYNNGASGSFAGHLALPRFGHGAINDRQVAKMYADERKLFYGSSSPVTGALANLSDDNASKLSYDEVTDSVYVGFASNVDELSGIAVINKESGGAATALDSHDGLVVKED